MKFIYHILFLKANYLWKTKQKGILFAVIIFDWEYINIVPLIRNND